MDNTDTHRLILHNDKIHSFGYVMVCLSRYCLHDPHQAEQCALLVHMTGKCVIKHGDFMQILEISENLSNLELKVTVEENESTLH